MWERKEQNFHVGETFQWMICDYKKYIFMLEWYISNVKNFLRFKRQEYIEWKWNKYLIVHEISKQLKQILSKVDKHNNDVYLW